LKQPARRDFLLAASMIWPLDAVSAVATTESFSFFHFCEPHITDQWNAVHGCRMAFDAMSRIGADFAIAGGDLVYDVCAQGWTRCLALYSMYKDAEKHIEMPVYHVMGNHDIYGLFRESGVPESDPHFGKRMFEQEIGPRHYSFAHKGWRFIVLDSIGMTPDRRYTGVIDAEQLVWLRSELTNAGKRTPIVVISHMPLFTAYMQYGSLTQVLSMEELVVMNAPEVAGILEGYNVKAVLQGHVHVREVIDNNKGCKYITSGAVCGNWWRGPRDGHPEGFARIIVTASTLQWRYYTYGFKAVAVSDQTPSIVSQPR
jgi:3',5'-cyclic-AMP phosphodiesterase